MTVSSLKVVEKAYQLAQTGRFKELLTFCLNARSQNSHDLSLIFQLGLIILEAGVLTAAEDFFMYLNKLQPNNPAYLFNIARIYNEKGDFFASQNIYQQILVTFPDNNIIRRSYLTSLEYDPSASDTDRRLQAEGWGRWIIDKQGGPKTRPIMQELINRKLRIGYVSADLCNHVVGLFIKNIFPFHNSKSFDVFCYHTGHMNDWVTDEIRKFSVFREVQTLSDIELADLIHSDGIDILIDLSGHTAGSRLSVFALRPAPVQISWLGYFSTTGLKYIDAVFLDEAYITSQTEKYFTEKIICLPKGRFCYTPVYFSPPAKPCPFTEKNFITFGSFNNTAKYNSNVFDLWAQILISVPNSRLILKWRTFSDEEYSKKVRKYFKDKEIDESRIELRGPSFHRELLNEYGDIDIALDPFPFSGCMTSCEALWMGVPVITLPQSRVVSRQTHSILKSIGLSEFSADCEDEYIKIAVELADNSEKLIKLRKNLPYLMLGSPLMDVKNFTLQLEEAFFNVYRSIENGSF